MFQVNVGHSTSNKDRHIPSIGNHKVLRSALLIFGACGLAGVLLDLDHIPIMFNPNWAAGTNLIRPEPHYWAILGSGLVLCALVAFICGLSAWMVLNKKREVQHET
jgi:hypothetical protein